MTEDPFAQGCSDWIEGKRSRYEIRRLVTWFRHRAAANILVAEGTVVSGTLYCNLVSAVESTQLAYDYKTRQSLTGFSKTRACLEQLSEGSKPT